jgi:hypothetical protein
MRLLGWLAMILGVVGIVAGLALVPLAFFARGWVTDRVDAVVSQVQEGLDRGVLYADEVQTSLEDLNATAADIQAQADEVASDPVVNGPAVQALASTVDRLISGPYAQLRSAYVGFSERIFAVTDAMQAVDRLLPGVTLPNVVIDDLHAVDDRLAEVDETVTGIQTRLEDGITVADQAAEVSQFAGQVQAGIGRINEGIDRAQTRVEEVQQQLEDLNSRVGGVVTIGVVVLAIIGLYLAGLHVLLFQQGRRWVQGGHWVSEEGDQA